jgi:hypothetical protein
MEITLFVEVGAIALLLLAASLLIYGLVRDRRVVRKERDRALKRRDD